MDSSGIVEALHLFFFIIKVLFYFYVSSYEVFMIDQNWYSRSIDFQGLQTRSRRSKERVCIHTMRARSELSSSSSALTFYKY
jgi:hypothetical protein